MAKSLTDLFLRLAKPNANGISRWVSVTEFVGRYARLKLGNGASYIRTGSALDKKYNIEKDNTITPGNRIDRIKLNGFKKKDVFNQEIRKDIREDIISRKCVMLGIRGSSVNTTIEVDHKDGRKSDWRVSDTKTQRLDDFQPLCKAANDVKRQICKECKQTNKRWDAKNILGNPYSFYAGSEDYTEDLGCIGCYQYDPVAYRKVTLQKIGKEVTRFILSRLGR